MMTQPSLSVFEMNQLAVLGVPVKNLVTDSRHVQPGDTFAAYVGEKLDGRHYIPAAIDAGANAVLWEPADFLWRSDWAIPNLPIEQLRNRIGDIASAIYGNPSSALRVIGITGTNGKTSCSHWLAHCFAQLGNKAAIIGTLGNGFPAQLEPSPNTTPDAVILQKQLAQYLKADAQYIAMEVSSHGLVQGRTNGVRFDCALFTNLSRDHLDYHGDMESYGAAKALLFDCPTLKNAIINIDDDFGATLAGKLKQRGSPVLTYGIGQGEINATRLVCSAEGIGMNIQTPWGEAMIQSALLGRFNASNLLGVLGVLLVSDIPLDDAVRALQTITPVAGRMQCLGGGEAPLVVIDYAHTPDALEQVLKTLRETVSGAGRLTCVFGCGGDRDKGKRPLMGAAASRWADRVIVSSDNPRNENPQEIITDIVQGISGEYQVMEDRKQAITFAIKHAARGDVVLIAGKGHEQYQEVAGTRSRFDDAKITEAVLRAQGYSLTGISGGVIHDAS